MAAMRKAHDCGAIKRAAATVPDPVGLDDIAGNEAICTDSAAP